MNRDGIADLVAFGSSTTSYFLGSGSGAFSVSGSQFIPGGNAACVGDLDGDGIPDVVVTHDDSFDPPVGGFAVIFGDGSGGVRSWHDVGIGRQLTGPVVGDFNGDGLQDVAVVSRGTSSVLVLPGDGSGGFGPPVSLPATGESQLVAGDFNADGFADLAVARGDGVLAVFLGSASGAFALHQTIAVGTGSGRAFAVDFNRDGVLDLSLMGVILIGTGQGSFAPPSPFPGIAGSGDFNQDGVPDLIVQAAQSLGVFFGDGFGAFVSGPGVALAIAGPVAAGDFDGDGKDDLTILRSGDVSVLRGIGAGLFDGARSSGNRGSAMWPPAIADFNGDGRPDLATFGLSDVSVLLNNGDGSFGVPIAASVPSGIRALTTGDFNRDGKIDIAASLYSGQPAAVLILLGDGTGHLGPPTSFPLFVFGAGELRVGDFNEDLKPDIVVVANGQLGILLGDGSGGFSPVQMFGSGQIGAAITVADVNGDGHRDVVVDSYSESSLQTYLGNGAGGFSLPITSGVPAFSRLVLVQDVNGDGKPDALVIDSNLSSTIVLLAGDGAGSFGTAVPIGPGGALAVADFDGDGHVEVAGFLGDRVSVFRREPVTGFHLSGTFLTLGGPGVAGDFDGDGKADIVGFTSLSSGVWLLKNTICIPRRLQLETDVSSCDAAGAPFAVQPALSVTDDGDNVLGCDAGFVTATIAPGSGTPGAALLGTTSVAVTSGLATFSDLSVDLPGRRYRLRFSHPEAGEAGSRSFSRSLPQPTITPSAQACTGSGARFEAGPGYDTYEWTLDGSIVGRTRFVTRTGLAAGSHLLALSVGQDGCFASSSTSVNIQTSPPAPAASSNSPIAFGGSVQLTASNVAGAAFQWTGPGGFASALQNPVIPNATPAASGTYRVVAQVGGCASTPASTEVRVLPAPLCPGCARPSFNPAALTFPADSRASAMVAGDFDGDGNLDVVVARDTTQASVTFHQGDGRGGFGPGVDSPIAGGSYARGIVAADINRDGLPDLLVSTDYLGMFVLLASGNGHFDSGQSFPEILGRVAVGDVNEDGWPDFIGARSNGVFAYLGDGTGGFLPGVPVGSVSGLPALGDFNGDHHLDIAVLHTDAVSVLLGAGNGSFGSASEYGVPAPAFNLAAADFDADGKSDLAIEYGNPFLGLRGTAILSGSPTGGLSFVRVLPGGAAPFLIVTDVNGDGRPDILYNWGELTLLLGEGGFEFGSPVAIRAGNTVTDAVFADFDRDGEVDGVVLSNYDFGSSLVVLRGVQSGILPNAPSVPVGPDLRAVVAADLDGDGDQDAAVASSSSGTVTVLLNDGNGNLVPTPALSAGAGSRGLVSADFNGDGLRDLAVINEIVSTVSVFLNNGAGGFGSPVSYSVGVQPFAIAAGDFNADGKKDLAIANYHPAFNSVSILLGTGTGAFVSGGEIKGFFNPASVAVADFNKDGRDDLAVLNEGPGSVSIVLSKADGSPGVPVDLAPPFGAQAMTVGDFNNDGNADLAVSRANPNPNVSVFLGDGAGGFGDAQIVGLPDAVGSLSVGDFNSDGKADLVVTRSNANEVSVLIGDGAGHFSPPVGYLAGRSPVGAAAADLNGDGRPDLLVANRFSGDLTVFINTNCVPSRLAVATNPSCAQPGQVFPTQPVVKVVDDGGNVVECETGPVMASIQPGTGTAGASLAGTTARPLVSGVALFTDLSIDQAGVGYSLRFRYPIAHAVLSRKFSVGSLLTVSITGPAEVCSAAAASFSADTGFELYLWSADGQPLGVGRTISLKGLSGGPHTLSVAAWKDGCLTTASRVITVLASPPAASNNGPICAGQTLQLGASAVSNAIYSWTGPNGFTSSERNPQIVSASVSATGTYNVTVTVGSCTSLAASTSAVVRALPSATITAPGSVCTNRVGNRASVPQLPLGATYSWAAVHGQITAGAGTNRITFTSSAAASVTLSVIVTDKDGCAQAGELEIPIVSCSAEPVGLDVDSSANGTSSNGNGVLEPGERVVVAPTWRNAGGAPLNLSATASSLTGPFASYAINDASADYGSVAAGAIGNCAATGNCYEMTVSRIGSRPATHWDATFRETLSDGDPPTVWPLHVGESFTDVPKAHTFYPYIERLLHSGLTTGCGPATFCPEQSVFRLQMAIFIARAQAGGDANVPSSGTAQGSAYNCSPGGTSLFTDVDAGNAFCRHVHYIYKTGVTTGCEPGKYCPDPEVTRAQMAMFVARAMAGSDAAVPQSYGPDPTTGRNYSCNPASPNLHFTDVTTSDIFCRHTHYLWAKDVISGFPDNTYGPALTVPRGAMAKFLSNGFNLWLYGP